MKIETNRNIDDIELIQDYLAVLKWRIKHKALQANQITESIDRAKAAIIECKKNIDAN